MFYHQMNIDNNLYSSRGRVLARLVVRSCLANQRQTVAITDEMLKKHFPDPREHLKCTRFLTEVEHIVEATMYKVTLRYQVGQSLTVETPCAASSRTPNLSE